MYGGGGLRVRQVDKPKPAEHAKANMNTDNKTNQGKRSADLEDKFIPWSESGMGRLIANLAHLVLVCMGINDTSPTPD